MSKEDYRASDEDELSFDLRVRGSIPAALGGSLIVPTNRRSKTRSTYARWHDSQTDLMRLDLYPGRPGRVRAHILQVDPGGADLPDRNALTEFDQWMFGTSGEYGYATQPNHGVNIAGNTVWATNLLFGAPLEVDIATWKPRRILRYLELGKLAPRVSGTSHFAWSLDHRYAYFHQSVLERESGNAPVRAADLTLIQLDAQTGSERTWSIRPPAEDNALETANFHSAFYFEEVGKRYIGLLRTGALLEHLGPQPSPEEQQVLPAGPSSIWILELDDDASTLQAELLPGIRELDCLALSHLDVDASSGDGFVLYANFKEADVAEETRGSNVYGEPAETVAEHYAGMVVEALNVGLVLRYERRGGQTSLRTFSQVYDPNFTSRGHSWLPINIQLDPARRRLFCSFAGFRPRLVSQHVAQSYPSRLANMREMRYVPPAVIRFDARTLLPDQDGDRGHIAYAEPMAMTVAGDGSTDYVFTFSPEAGLRIYLADDLTRMVLHAEPPQLLHWKDSHFRPDPAHIQLVQR